MVFSVLTPNYTYPRWPHAQYYHVDPDIYYRGRACYEEEVLQNLKKINIHTDVSAAKVTEPSTSVPCGYKCEGQNATAFCTHRRCKIAMCPQHEKVCVLSCARQSHQIARGRTHQINTRNAGPVMQFLSAACLVLSLVNIRYQICHHSPPSTINTRKPKLDLLHLQVGIHRPCISFRCSDPNRFPLNLAIT